MLTLHLQSMKFPPQTKWCHYNSTFTFAVCTQDPKPLQINIGSSNLILAKKIKAISFPTGKWSDRVLLISQLYYFPLQFSGHNAAPSHNAPSTLTPSNAPLQLY
jgi:hypothetical protein